MTSRKLTAGIAFAASSLVALTLAAWATGGSQSRTATPAPVGSGKASPTKSVCGLGNGRKARGTPVRIGAIVTVVPGLNWDEITDNARAYFNCVNDNGGINGRPIRYFVHVEQINPEQVAAFARRLVEEEKVVGLVGTIDVLDCAVNEQYYARRGFVVIGLGVHDKCYGGTKHHAAINMGPALSTLGAAQYLIRQGVKKLVVVSPAGVDAAGTWNKPAVAWAKSKGIDAVDVHDPYPAQGPQYALKYVQLAGNGGGVVLDFTTSEALKVLKAAESLGIANRVKWAASTPSNDTTFSKNAGRFWDGKIGINAELNLLDSKGPDAQLYRGVYGKYVPKKWGMSSFGQFGFLAARVATETLLTLRPNQLTARGVNAAFLRIKNWKSDLLCRPWYVGNIPGRIPNNWDLTVTPRNGKMVMKERCFQIAGITNELKATRRAENRLKLTKGASYPPPAWQRGR
jgi:branched-chain amino acid transport system substrate-binding protein